MKNEVLRKLRNVEAQLIKLSAAKKASHEPAVYVGTYAKYNDANIQGKWLKLDHFHSKDDFLDACRELHKDESDPELMFQDFENFPEAFYGESHLADALWDWLELDERERDVVSAYLSENDLEAVSDIVDKFKGTASSVQDFASDYVDDLGIENLSEDTLSNYLSITPTDIRVIANDNASSLVEDMSEDEILEKAGMEDEYENEEDEHKKERILDEARDEAESEISDDIQRQLKQDPLGYFSELGYSVKDVLKHNLMYFDYQDFARELEHDYNFIKYHGKIFVFES